MRDTIENLFYQVQDPNYQIHDTDVPAVTTLLYKICSNDHALFDEACRVVRLFMEAAYEEGKKSHDA